MLHALLRTGSFSAHKRGSLWCRKQLLLSLPKKSKFEVNVYPDVQKNKGTKVAAGRAKLAGIRCRLGPKPGVFQ